MTPQSLTLTTSPSFFSPEEPTVLVVCERMKSDTKIRLEISLDGKEWVELEATRDRVLRLIPSCKYKATLDEGRRQEKPVKLHFFGTIQNATPTTTREAKETKPVKQVTKQTAPSKEQSAKPVASGIQLRRSSTGDNKGSSGPTSR